MLVIRKEYKVVAIVAAAFLGVAGLYGGVSLLKNFGGSQDADSSQQGGSSEIVTVNIPDSETPQGLSSGIMGLPPKDTSETEQATTSKPKEDPFAESARKDGRSNDDVWTTAWNTGKVSTENTTPLLIKTGEPNKGAIVDIVIPGHTDETKSTDKPRSSNTGTILTTGTYVVQPGDNYSRIAAKVYGNKHLYGTIEKANPGIEPTRLKPGMTIKVPPVETVQLDRGSIASEPEVIGTIDTKSQYKVVAGDTLHRIAQKLYGKTGMWQAIYDTNKQKIGPDAGRLKVGTVLLLPQTPVLN